MSNDNTQFEKSKLFYKLKNEVEDLEKLDQKSRVYGRSPKINKIIQCVEELKIAIIGEGCEFYELGWCEVLNEKCQIQNKIDCEIRKNKLKEQGKNIEALIIHGRRPHQTKLKRKEYIFDEVEKTKTLERKEHAEKTKNVEYTFEQA